MQQFNYNNWFVITLTLFLVLIPLVLLSSVISLNLTTHGIIGGNSKHKYIYKWDMISYNHDHSVFIPQPISALATQSWIFLWTQHWKFVTAPFSCFNLNVVCWNRVVLCQYSFRALEWYWIRMWQYMICILFLTWLKLSWALPSDCLFPVRQSCPTRFYWADSGRPGVPQIPYYQLPQPAEVRWSDHSWECTAPTEIWSYSRLRRNIRPILR